MVTQQQILDFIRRKKRAVAKAELMRRFDVPHQRISRKIIQLNKFGFIDIIIDGKKHLIVINEEKIKGVI